MLKVLANWAMIGPVLPVDNPTDHGFVMPSRVGLEVARAMNHDNKTSKKFIYLDEPRLKAVAGYVCYMFVDGGYLWVGGIVINTRAGNRVKEIAAENFTALSLTAEGDWRTLPTTGDMPFAFDLYIDKLIIKSRK